VNTFRTLFLESDSFADNKLKYKLEKALILCELLTFNSGDSIDHSTLYKVSSSDYPDVDHGLSRSFPEEEKVSYINKERSHNQTLKIQYSPKMIEEAV